MTLTTDRSSEADVSAQAKLLIVFRDSFLHSVATSFLAPALSGEPRRHGTHFTLPNTTCLVHFPVKRAFPIRMVVLCMCVQRLHTREKARERTFCILQKKSIEA